MTKVPNTFDPERDKTLGITGGPPPKQRGKRDWLMPFAFIGPIVIVAVLVFGALVKFGGAGNEAPAKGSEPPASIAPVPATHGMSKAQLQGFAQAVANALFVDKDTEKVNFIIVSAETMTGCNYQGYLGGPTDPPGLEDLSEPKTRAWIRDNAAERGWDAAFAKAGGKWIVIAQEC